MSRRGSSKDLRALLDDLVPGCKVETTGGGHIKVTGPAGTGIVFLPSTPSDYRAVQNARSSLRRAGLLQK